MSEEQENKPQEPQEPEIKSIFDQDAGEAPEEGAQTVDEGNGEPRLKKEVTKDGDLKATVSTGGIDPYDHSAEQAAIDEQKEKEGVAPPKLPEREPIAPNNPAMLQNPHERLQEEIEKRFTQEFGGRDIEVTSEDRDAFVRAALTDTELIFEIPIEALNATIKVAMPSDEFTNSASAAVTRWGKADHIDTDSDLQWLLAFQQLHAWFQVREINGEVPEWADYWADGMPPIRTLREEMKTPECVAPFTGMNAVRWRMILDAIRTAEGKYKICIENWHNKSFFIGADTD